jgi:hypothetical protein
VLAGFALGPTRFGRAISTPYLPAVSTAQETAGMLSQLEAERQTGCLTISSAEGMVCRVYLLMGQIFHAEGPDAQGVKALAEALLWPDSALSFDPNAKLPGTQTIGGLNQGLVRFSVLPRVPGDGARPGVEFKIVRRSPANTTPGVNTLSSDPRLIVSSIAALGGAVAAVLIPFALLGVAWLTLSNKPVSDGFATSAVISLPVMIAAWLAAYFGFRFLFFRDAVMLEGAQKPEDIPRVVEAGAGVITGEPELALQTPVRSTVGRLGRCWVEVYPQGLQISKGPDHPQPRWQFAFHELLQVEAVDLQTVGRYGTSDQYFVRIIAAQPRIAFLIGSHWRRNKTLQQLVERLRAHEVPTLAETFSS